MNFAVREAGRKIFLIVDGYSVHNSRQVSQWLASHEAQLRLILLSARSPGLNRDEFLNHGIKQNPVGQRQAASQDDLIASVCGH
jgi:hypothetical protein